MMWRGHESMTAWVTWTSVPTSSRVVIERCPGSLPAATLGVAFAQLRRARGAARTRRCCDRTRNSNGRCVCARLQARASLRPRAASRARCAPKAEVDANADAGVEQLDEVEGLLLEVEGSGVELREVEDV